MLKSKLIQAALLTVGLAVSAHGQTRETMDLGRGVQVYLREPKADALAAVVGAGYNAKPFETDNNQFTVNYRNSESGYYHFVALLGFSPDLRPNLTFINKGWDQPEESSDFAFAKAIFYASQSLIAQGCRSVSMDTRSDDQPDVTQRTLRLYCEGSNRRFEITSVDLGAGSSVGKQMSASLSEILQLPEVTPQTDSGKTK